MVPWASGMIWLMPFTMESNLAWALRENSVRTYRQGETGNSFRKDITSYFHQCLFVSFKLRAIGLLANVAVRTKLFKFAVVSANKQWGLVGYLAGVLDHAHSGGVQSNVQSVQDVDHKLPHGLKLVRPNTARAVDKEDQVHRTRLTLVVGTWKDITSLFIQCFQPPLQVSCILRDLHVQINKVWIHWSNKQDVATSCL